MFIGSKTELFGLRRALSQNSHVPALRPHPNSLVHEFFLSAFGVNHYYQVEPMTHNPKRVYL